MRRKWIVRVRLAGEETAPVDDGVDLAAKFEEALSGLRGRVAGELAFALVPSTGLARAMELLGHGFPLHLVVPSESGPGGCLAETGWESLRECAASVNVQPGPGTARENWVDCCTWLDSITEIDLVLADSARAEANAAEKPAMIFRLNDGSAEFSGFDDEPPLTDAKYAQIVRDVFGSGETPSGTGTVKTCADNVATRCAPWFRFLETGSLFLNISPGILLALGGIFLWQLETKAIAKFSAALLASFAALGLKRVRSRRRWLSARAMAEICRSVGHSGGVLAPLFPPAADHLSSHATLARSLAIAHAEAIPELEPDASAIRERYLAERLGGDDGQIAYFSRQAEKARARRKWVKAVFQTATVLALLSTGFALLSLLGYLPGTEAFNLRWIANVATYAFPALAAAAIGYLGLSETTRRADYYGEMVRLLEQQRKTLLRLQSRSSIKEAIRKTESLLLEEFSNWLRRRVY